MEQWIGWGIQTITILALGAIAWFLREMKKTIDDKVEANKVRIAAVEKELSDFKDKMPFLYVLREDFIRAMTNVDKKLDEITRLLLQKKGSE